MQASRFLVAAPFLPLILAMLPAPGLAIPAGDPSAASKADEPQAARVTLQAEDKQELVGSYFAPLRSLDKATAVLLVHNAGSNREALLPIAMRLHKSGFAVLTLDLRGHGESANEACTWAQFDADAQTKAWNAMAADVKAGVDFLSSQKDVQSARVCMLASGAGAGLIARQAVRDERVRELVLIDPAAESYGRSLVKDLQQLAGIPTLIVVGKGDNGSGKRLIEAVSRSGGEVKSIEVKAGKLETAAILGDKSMHHDVSKWMVDKLNPKVANKN